MILGSSNIRQGEEPPTFAARGFMELAQYAKLAALDLGDAEWKLKAIADHVDLLTFAEKEAKLRYQVGTTAPHSYHTVRYYLLDAQIEQMQMQKALGKK
jgi:hypothetical protein